MQLVREIGGFFSKVGVEIRKGFRKWQNFYFEVGVIFFTSVVSTQGALLDVTLLDLELYKHY